MKRITKLNKASLVVLIACAVMTQACAYKAKSKGAEGQKAPDAKSDKKDNGTVTGGAATGTGATGGDAKKDDADKKDEPKTDVDPAVLDAAVKAGPQGSFKHKEANPEALAVPAPAMIVFMAKDAEGNEDQKNILKKVFISQAPQNEPLKLNADGTPKAPEAPARCKKSEFFEITQISKDGKPVYTLKKLKESCEGSCEKTPAALACVPTQLALPGLDVPKAEASSAPEAKAEAATEEAKAADVKEVIQKLEILSNEAESLHVSFLGEDGKSINSDNQEYVPGVIEDPAPVVDDKKEEPKKEEPKKEEPKKEEPKEEPKKDEPKKEEPKKDDNKMDAKEAAHAAEVARKKKLGIPLNHGKKPSSGKSNGSGKKTRVRTKSGNKSSVKKPATAESKARAAKREAELKAEIARKEKAGEKRNFGKAPAKKADPKSPAPKPEAPKKAAPGAAPAPKGPTMPGAAPAPKAPPGTITNGPRPEQKAPAPNTPAPGAAKPDAPKPSAPTPGGPKDGGAGPSTGGAKPVGPGQGPVMPDPLQGLM